MQRQSRITDCKHLYLVRHGEALSKYEDPQRSLSSKGRTDVQRVAAHLAEVKAMQVDRIYHSGKLRARQTAEILAEHLKPSSGVSEGDSLMPNNDPTAWADRLTGEEASLMLVGHLPHLGRLAALLVTGNAGREVVSFPAAGVACLEHDETDRWSLIWTVGP